ncbi:MAG: NUDIX hydrolase [Gammaproteobacteria bacterium]|jgi:8-oxo-dGTP pyrophosphatase MutT (NUDIX family)
MTAADDRFSICLLVESENRLLFLRRAPDEHVGALQWGFPAGRIERGESPRQCAEREMNEEIGMDHRLAPVQSLGPVRDTFYGGRFEIHLFHYRWLGGSIELNEEHTASRWVGPDQFGELDAMLGVEQDIVLLDIWPAATFDPARLGTLPSR